MPATPEVLSRPWPLTGRFEDLDAICDAIETGCTAAFLLGEPGSGKTRLAREALRRLEADGWATATATATESARATPLGALAHLVPSGAVDAPATVFAATRDALAERSADRPVVLHVDDVHHLDPSSASLLVSLVEAGAVRLVLTLRLGLRVPEAIAALRAADNVATFTLGALDPSSIDTLLHRVLGGPLDGVAEAQLVHTSGGNPLYLRELVVGAIADGSLQEVSGVWRLTGALPATEALGERVLGRMAVLPDEARDALELIAVGEPVGLDLLEQMVDPAVLEVLEERALIRVEVEQRRHQVRLAHPVYGEILRAGLGRLRRRRLARLHADAVAATGARRRDDALRIVRWQIEAGIAPDPAVVVTGARLARHHHDWTTVAMLSRAALDAGHRDAAGLLAEAHFELGEWDEVDAVTDAILASPDGLSEEALAEVHRCRSASLMWGHDDEAAAVEALEVAIAATADPGVRGLLEFSRASLLVWSARIDEALAFVDGLLESEADRVAVQAALVVELTSSVCGPVGRTVELSDRWFPVHLALPELAGTNNPGNHLLTKTVALTHLGRLAEAQQLAELAYGASVANRSPIGQMWFTLELGRIALACGDAVAAQRWFREQVALCRGTGHRRPITLGLGGLAMAEARLGNAEAAAAAIAEIDEDPSAVIPLFAVETARARAWAKVALGDPAEARRLLVDAAATAEALGITMLAALARFDALRLGSTDQAAPLAAAAASVGSPLVDLAARWAAAPNDGSELQAVAEGLEELGALLYAAECFAAAADALRRAGQQRGAAAADQRAEELVRRCRGSASPTLTKADGVVPLTAREREIALLVAEGLTTKEVAERLFVSARTVSNHLQNAYAKLGISKRTELNEALRRFGAEEEHA